MQASQALRPEPTGASPSGRAQWHPISEWPGPGRRCVCVPSPRSHGRPQALLRGLWSQVILFWLSHSPSLPSSSPAIRLLRGPTS